MNIHNKAVDEPSINGSELQYSDHSTECSRDIVMLGRIGGMSYGAVTRISSTLELKRARPTTRILL